MNKAMFGLMGLIFLLALGFVYADSITSYVVPSSVPLGEEVSATGIYADGSGGHPIVMCSFFIIDKNGNVVYRATDQYSNTTGRFSMQGWATKEPLTLRDETYDLRSECGTTNADANFFTGQRESIARAGAQEFAFVTSPENTDTVFIWGGIIGLFAFVVLIIVGVVFMRVK